LVEAVVFDIGGVLLDWDPRYLYREVFDDHEAMEWFLAHVCTSQWHEAHDRGVSTVDSCRSLAELYPEYAEEIEVWASRSEEMVAGEIPGTPEILDELTAAGVPCYALSNMEEETYPLRAARFPFFARFAGVVISGNEKVAKPEPRIFEILLHRYRLEAPSTLFVDDSPANLAAAAGLGMPTLAFESPAHLRASLVGLGLLGAE
jgi:2-haloacid dehalogenase